MRCIGVLLCLGVAGTAWAKDKPIVDAAHCADESTVSFQLGHDSDGYWIEASGGIVGIGGKDRVRLDIRLGGKPQYSIECTAQTGGFECTPDQQRGKRIKKAGALEADVILESDADDKEYLLRTFKVNAKNWDGQQEWEIEPDDVLGTAYFAPVPAQRGEYATLRFWVANAAGFDAILRCTVDGKPLPDISGNADTKDALGVTILKGDKRTEWVWSRVQFYSMNWYVAGKDASSETVYVSQHPGTWQCQLRKSGVVVRELSFKANAKGEVEPHPMQEGKGARPLPPRVAQVDIRIPKDNGLDKRIKPDVIKKSRGFGMPWPQHDSVKVLLAALPPAYENANPVAAKKPAGKVIIGAEAKPPKVIDESQTVVRLNRNGKGYDVQADAVIWGVSQAPSNMYRFEWKQGSKTLATIKCSWTQSDDRKQTWVRVECTDRDLVVTAKGALEGHLIYTDDKEGQEYLVRAYKVTVAKYPSDGDPVWQIVPDDLLATAWAHQGSEQLRIRFWLGLENTSVDLRCNVDGKKIPDIGMSGNSADLSVEANVYDKKGNAKKYIWQQAGAGGTDVLVGMPPKDFKPFDDKVSYLGQYPGAWDCQVRQNGKVLRQLLFTVNNKGYVEGDPAQAGVYPDWVVPIDLRFGKDVIDVRVRPDAMKKSRGFGLPWPTPPTKPFPKASGLPDPK